MFGFKFMNSFMFNLFKHSSMSEVLMNLRKASHISDTTKFMQ